MSHTTVAAGMSAKRPGAEQRSSDGCRLTVGTEAGVEDADRFHAVAWSLPSEPRGSSGTGPADGAEAARAPE